MSILVWDALSQLSIDRTKCPDIPVGLKWNRSTNGLLMVLANGKYAEWAGVIPRNLPDPLKAFDADSIAVQAYASQKQTLDNMFADEEAAEKAATTPAIATSPTDTSSKNSSARHAASSTATASSSRPNISSKSTAAGDYEVVSFGTTTKTATSDFGASTAASSKSRSTSSYDMDVANDYEDDDSQAGAYGSAGKSWGGSGLFDLQPPFMPGATQSGATRRILVWNHIGSIMARVEEFPSPQTSMEMDFNDTSLYKPYSLTQPMVIDLATMSEQGIFTSGRVVSRDHRVTTTLQFHLFNKFGMKSDWTARLEHGEAALALAAGDTWSAVATSQRRLRLFGEAGYKLAVMSLPGPVVSMVGKGSLLAVFYHCGNPFGSNGVPKSYSSAVSANGVVDEGNSQNLGWWIFNVQSRRFLSTGSPLPLSPGAQLNWIGFSTEDALCTFDSSGTLRQLAATRQFVSGSTPLLSVEAAHAQSVLLPSWSDVWFDVLDTNNTESQKELDGSVVWPIAVTEEKMRYAKVSAHSDGPSSQPKPIPHSMALSMPFTSPSADPAASNENKLIRNAITLGSRLASTIDRSSTCDGPLGDAEAENEEDDDPSFLFNFASDKDILSAQQNVDKMVLQSIREACHEGRVERAYGLAKSLFFKKSFQIAVTIASKTDQYMLAEKIAELSVRKDAERVRRQKALKRMIAPAPAPRSGSQSQSLPPAFDMSPVTRKSGAKRSLPESSAAAAASSSKDRVGSDDEFEVEDEEDDEDGNGLGSPASKKFTTQAIEDDNGDDHAFDRDGHGDDADDDSEDENGMDVDPATRGTTGSVFKSSPFSIAPPFKQGGGRLVDTLSSIGKSKNASSGASSQTKASGSKKSAASPAPKKSSSRASTGKK
jgi:chromosome transmission fidelity protein 4